MNFKFTHVDEPMSFTMREVLTDMLTQQHELRSQVRSIKPGQPMRMSVHLSMSIVDNTDALQILDDIEDAEYQARQAKKGKS